MRIERHRLRNNTDTYRGQTDILVRLPRESSRSLPRAWRGTAPVSCPEDRPGVSVQGSGGNQGSRGAAMKRHKQNTYQSCWNHHMCKCDCACVCAKIWQIESRCFMSLLHQREVPRTPGCATSSGFAPHPPEPKIQALFPSRNSWLGNPGHGTRLRPWKNRGARRWIQCHAC